MAPAMACVFVERKRIHSDTHHGSPFLKLKL